MYNRHSSYRYLQLGGRDTVNRYTKQPEGIFEEHTRLEQVDKLRGKILAVKAQEEYMQLFNQVEKLDTENISTQ